MCREQHNCTYSTTHLSVYQRAVNTLHYNDTMLVLYLLCVCNCDLPLQHLFRFIYYVPFDVKKAPTILVSILDKMFPNICTKK